MKRASIVPATFFLGFIATVVGAYLKILHAGGADILLAIGLLATAVFIITAVIEVISSSKIRHQEKILWTIAFILGGTITGLVYMIIGRKRIASQG
jgi:hypothetical protein